MKVGKAGASKPKGKKADDPNEMRLVVVADSDIVSDGLLFSRAMGNRYLLLDTPQEVVSKSSCPITRSALAPLLIGTEL